MSESSSPSSEDDDPISPPPAPTSCDACGNTDFIQRTKPPRDDLNIEEEYIFAYHECSECEESYNERPELIKSDSDIRQPTWQGVFGHPEPYDHQEEAIVDAIKTALDDGLSIVEGGCGTGKTMIALTAGIRLIKDPSTKYEQIFVLTSVKQQQRQFEDDLEIINENLPEDINPAKAITLVGKGDLCPYSREEIDDITEGNIAHRCRELRDRTSGLMSKDTSGNMLAHLATVSKLEEYGENEDNSDVAESTDDNPNTFSTAGVESPYVSRIPSQEIEYCPFYAKYKQHGDPLFTFGHAPNCILDSEQIVKQAVDKGVCPHSAMSSLCRDADVVIANYYHAFDSNTLMITHELLNESTLLVCDEAHMLEPRVRQILSTECSMYELKQSLGEISAVYNGISNSQHTDYEIKSITNPETETALQELSKQGVTRDMIKDAYTVLENLYEMLNESITAHLDQQYSDWRSNPSKVPRSLEIPFRNPERIEKDMVTKWAESQNVPDGFWDLLPQIADAVSNTLDMAQPIEESNQWSISHIQELFNDWFQKWSTNKTEYFREIKLIKRDQQLNGNKWYHTFSGKIQLHNVMPRSIIGKRISSFGGGILMSATLEPISVYKQVTGVSSLEAFENLTVTDRTYNTSFPEENRFSAALNLPKFTNENRGNPADNTETRTQYLKAILTVCATTPGNVLVCMPSYKEAKWAADMVRARSDIQKEVLIDQSSSEAETKQLKQDFFNGGPKVLTTSLKGTLTEGVDYSGDRLLACIICGVPIDNIASPKTQAVRTAYEQEFNDPDEDNGFNRGFNYGLTVPAVRKTRQALGRVIRGTDDVGVRILADERYTTKTRYNVNRYLSERERKEYQSIDDVDNLYSQLEQFWQKHQF